MVQIQQTRINSGNEFNLGTTKHQALDALNKLLVYELGYGGSIVSISEKIIVVETEVMDCVDTTVFSGEKDEMEPLIAAACFFVKSSEDFQEDIFRQSFEDACLFQKAKNDYEGVSPLFVKIGLPLLIGENRVKTTAMYAVDITEAEDIRLGLSSRLCDLLIAIQMQQAGICTLKEALN